jgi:hypothetical protein
MFALVSLFHGRAMALTVAAGSPIHVSAAPADLTVHHHHHAAAPDIVADQPASEVPANGALCPMLGCSIGMGPVTPQLTVTWCDLGQIQALPVLALSAALSEPSVPPPRLTV